MSRIANLERSYELRTQQVGRLTDSIDISNQLLSASPIRCSPSSTFLQNERPVRDRSAGCSGAHS